MVAMDSAVVLGYILYAGKVYEYHPKLSITHSCMITHNSLFNCCNSTASAKAVPWKREKETGKYYRKFSPRYTVGLKA